MEQCPGTSNAVAVTGGHQILLFGVIAAIFGALILYIWQLFVYHDVGDNPNWRNWYVDPVPHSGPSNLPRPATFFLNSRHQKLYYALRGPPPYVENKRNPACKGVLFVNVGYGAHTTRPSYQPLLNALASGWCVATFDWAGQGYSEGARCLVHPAGMLSDLSQFVDLVLNGVDARCGGGGKKLGKGAKEARDDRGRAGGGRGRGGSAVGREQRPVPWFVVGQSMGGCMALLFSQHAWRTKRLATESDNAPAARSKAAAQEGTAQTRGSMQPRQQNVTCYRGFSGCVAVAPMVTVDTPAAHVLAIMKVVARLFPLRALPSFVSSELSDEATWKDPATIAWHINFDSWGCPGGLGWGRPMRWGSAAALIEMSAVLCSLLRDTNGNGGDNDSSDSGGGGGSGSSGMGVEGCALNFGRSLEPFPVLLIHDPKDQITQYKGSKLVLDRSRARLKELVDVHGGMHDLMCTSSRLIADATLAFVDKAENQKA
mmetsp:Transcript_60771/g.121956  ORF Transcript_60771/g.121956 Transcript_60771/m.121956 type:complete len:485 (-) Transcript_60771:159-1613(-)